MITKKIFWALALPVALASCTADDLVTESTENPVLPGRKTVGNITFVAPDNADTRLVWENNKLNWTETDKLGAALMDELATSHDDPDPTKNYDIVDKLYSNYRYDYVDGKFENGKATFVEGNYFVYAQFNEKQKRTGLAYEIPAVQQSGEDGRGSWYANQMFLDHIFVKEGDSEKELNLLPVFPLVTFKATYEGTEDDVVIRKIVVTSTDGTKKFGVAGTVNPAKTSGNVTYKPLDGLNPTGDEYSEEDYKIENEQASLADIFDVYKKAVEDFNAGIYTIKKDGRDAGVNDMPYPVLANFLKAGEGDTDTSESMTLNFDNESGSVAGIMVVPQQNTQTKKDGTKLRFEIYTNKGLVTMSGAADAMSNAFTFTDKHDYTDGSGVGSGDDLLKDRAMRAIAFNDGIQKSFLSEMKAGQQEKIEFQFKDDAILVPSKLAVTSTEELKYYLTNWYEGKSGQIIGVSGNNTVAVTATPAKDGKVEVDNEVLAFMANSSNPALEFDGTVTIPAGTNTDALDKIKKNASNDLTIINEAALTWTDKDRQFTNITNKGTLTVGKAEGEAENFTGTITNLGTLELQANVTSLTNGSNTEPKNDTAVVTLKKGKVSTALTNHAVVNVEGTVEIEGLANSKTVEVTAGKLTTSGASTNNGTITVDTDAAWDVAGTSFDNNGSDENGAKAGVVTNNGKITVTAGTFENKTTTASTASKKVDGKVINNNQIACGKSGTFKNSAAMEANDGSITLISENAEGAEIVITENITAVNVPADKSNGKITFVVTEQASLTKVPGVANSLRINSGTIDFGGKDWTAVKHVEFISITEVNNNGGNNNPTFDNVKFDGGTCKVNCDLTVNQQLEITEGTTVMVNKTLTFGGSSEENFNNNGIILIVGTLKFTTLTSDKEDNIGEHLFTGGEQSNIEWAS